MKLLLSEVENRIDFKLLLQKTSNFYKEEYVILFDVSMKLHVLSILWRILHRLHDCNSWDMTDCRKVSSQTSIY